MDYKDQYRTDSNEKDAKYKTNYAYYEKDEFGDDNSVKRK